MIWKIILFLLLLGLLVWAVRMKVFLKRTRVHSNLEGTVSSPASVVLGEIVAVAGGIYLSLILLTSFLQINPPDNVTMFSMNMDPIAVTSLAIALIQPICQALFYRYFKRI